MEVIIDTERTRSIFRSQLDSFMHCFIMTCSPFEEKLENLERDAEQRKGITGCSWIEQVAGFCSYRTIDKVFSVQNPGLHPYLDIRLEPSSGILTSNRFLWDCYPCFEVPVDGAGFLGREFGNPTRTKFLDIEGEHAQLDYLKTHLGGRILQCYAFSSEDDFHNERYCYRFATAGYLRECILITQSFVLDYLQRHPLDCFDGPYIMDRPNNEFACAGKTKMDILSPILSEYYPMIKERKIMLDEELTNHGLLSECI